MCNLIEDTVHTSIYLLKHYFKVKNMK